MSVYPLICVPIFKPRIWGGQRLATKLGKAIDGSQPMGESWEVADLPGDCSVIRNGPNRGATLHALVEKWGEKLLGRAAAVDGQFPLLIKFLDAEQHLSVQVHPTAEVAAALGGDTRVKHEAWYVIHAEPDGCIYRGFKGDVMRQQVQQAIDAGTLEGLLERIPVRAGQCYYLPSGTIHALGAGVLVAEVQTPSDTTFRLYDWNRVDAATGKPRDLHIAEALQSLSLEPIPAGAEKKSHVASLWTSVSSLVSCPSFRIERVRMVPGVRQAIPYDEMVIWMVLEGAGKVHAEGVPAVDFGRGDTVILPAALKKGEVETTESSMWLEVTIPIPSSLTGFDKPERMTRASMGTGGSEAFVQLNLPEQMRDGSASAGEHGEAAGSE